MLLWLSVEYEIGLQDRFLSLYPYLTLLSIVIPFWCYHRAFKEKIAQLEGNLTLKQALASGLIITFFSCLLALPVHILFYKQINPDLLPAMFDYAVNVMHLRPEVAANVVNYKSYLMSSVSDSLISGLLVTVILAYRMRTVK